MNSHKQSPPLLPKSKSREVRKLEKERDLALDRLLRMKAKQKRKKIQKQRQTLGRQVFNLAMRHTQAVIDGEI